MNMEMGQALCDVNREFTDFFCALTFQVFIHTKAFFSAKNWVKLPEIQLSSKNVPEHYVF